MRTIPKFMSAGLIVTVCCCFLRLARYVRCCRVRLSVVRSQIVGRLSSISCFVSLMYFSRCAIPLYLCCGVSIVGLRVCVWVPGTCECSCRCVSLRVCVWMRVCARAYVPVCVRSCLRACECEFLNVYLYACFFVRVFECVRACVRRCMLMCVRPCVSVCLLWRGCVCQRACVYLRVCVGVHVCVRVGVCAFAYAYGAYV